MRLGPARQRLRLGIAALLAAALVLGGCDGDDRGGGDDEPASESTDADSEPMPTKAELRSALLTLGDMPAGWSQIPYDTESEDNVCPAEVAGPLGLDEEPPSVGAQFVANALEQTSVSEAIQVVPEGRGPELIPVARDAMAACEGQVYDGRTAHVSPLEFVPLGDESAAYTVRLDDIPITVLFIVTGDIAIVMSSYDLAGGKAVALLATHAQHAVAKAEDVLGQPTR